MLVLFLRGIRVDAPYKWNNNSHAQLTYPYWDYNVFSHLMGIIS